MLLLNARVIPSVAATEKTSTMIFQKEKTSTRSSRSNHPTTKHHCTFCLEKIRREEDTVKRGKASEQPSGPVANEHNRVTVSRTAERERNGHTRGSHGQRRQRQLLDEPSWPAPLRSAPIPPGTRPRPRAERDACTLQKRVARITSLRHARASCFSLSRAARGRQRPTRRDSPPADTVAAWPFPPVVKHAPIIKRAFLPLALLV
jgi:hypothetical protein